MLIDEERDLAVLHRAAVSFAIMLSSQSPCWPLCGLVASSHCAMIARALAQHYAAALQTACMPFQFGLSTRAGTEALLKLLQVATACNSRATVFSVDAVGAGCPPRIRSFCATAPAGQAPPTQDPAAAHPRAYRLAVGFFFSWLFVLFCGSPRASYLLRMLPPDSTVTAEFARKLGPAVAACLSTLLHGDTVSPLPAAAASAAHLPLGYGGRLRGLAGLPPALLARLPTSSIV